MAFHDVRLPDNVERGASGGPRFKTTVMTLSSGLEKRNIEWSRVRGEFDIGYGVDSKESLSEVIAFFYARQGRAHSFRFKDWADYQIGSDTAPQQFASGAAGQRTFQMEKRYTSGGYTFARPISKIVPDTLRIFINSVEQVNGWTADHATGEVTFNTAPPALAAIQAICEFDLSVRFDTDALDINMEVFNVGSIPQIPVVEVKRD